MELTTEQIEYLNDKALELKETSGYIQSLLEMIEEIWDNIPWYHKAGQGNSFKKGMHDYKISLSMFKAIAEQPKNAFIRINSDIGIDPEPFMEQTLLAATQAHVNLTSDWQVLVFKYDQTLKSNPWSIKKLCADIFKLVLAVTWVIPVGLVKKALSREKK